MSTSGGKKGGGKGPPKDTKNDDKDQKDATKSNSKEQPEKDETASNNGAGGDEATPTPSKPPSAGTNVRDAAQKVLMLCQKGEWSPVDQVLKSIEKAVAAAGEEAITNPLAGVADPVSLKNIFETVHS